MRTLIIPAVLALVLSRLAGAGEPDASNGTDRPRGTIAFASLAPRGWDLYVTELETRATRRLTDHPALDSNAAFAPDGRTIAFVSERDGNLELYRLEADGSGAKRLTDEFALDDRPAWSPDGSHLAFSSTRQPADTPGRSWNAVYVMTADGSDVRRVSGPTDADYSPAWSPRGDLLAVASGSGVAGGTDLFVMTPDGRDRRLVVKDGGWPAFAADGDALFFHSRREGKWGIWKVALDGSKLERITPPDVEAFTPHAARDGKHLVASVVRDGHRQVALIGLETRGLTFVTDDPTDHWSPAPAPDGRSVVYHKASRGASTPNVEVWGHPPGTDVAVLRVAGSFPAFSPDGRRIALTGDGFGRLDVMDSDGRNRTTLHQARSRTLFSVSWAHEGDWIAFTHGGAFAGPKETVNIALIRPDGLDHHEITADAANNGFPSFSPDGRQLVFRSGRDVGKNLYIMDRDGSNVRRLTEGKWTDTMCDWSPTGEWIVFASDRDGDFEVWRIRPDGSGLKKIVAGGGRNNHPHFARDGRWIVFTSKRGGFSAEEITMPHQPQPYGDLFAVRIDGTGLIRLTHNGAEDGTPAWGPPLERKPTTEGQAATAGEY